MVSTFIQHHSNSDIAIRRHTGLYRTRNHPTNTFHRALPVYIHRPSPSFTVGYVKNLVENRRSGGSSLPVSAIVGFFVILSKALETTLNSQDLCDCDLVITAEIESIDKVNKLLVILFRQSMFQKYQSHQEGEIPSFNCLEVVAMFHEVLNWISKLCGDFTATVRLVFANIFPFIRGYVEWVVGLNELLGACSGDFLLLLALLAFGTHLALPHHLPFRDFRLSTETSESTRSVSSSSLASLSTSLAAAAAMGTVDNSGKNFPLQCSTRSGIMFSHHRCMPSSRKLRGMSIEERLDRHQGPLIRYFFATLTFPVLTMCKATYGIGNPCALVDQRDHTCPMG